MGIEKNRIFDALKQVTDPVSGKDLVTAGKIEELNVEGNTVSFTLSVQGIDSRVKSDLNFACMNAINLIYPKADVHVHMSMKSPFAESARKVLPQVKHILAVASGKGGVGKSTISTNLALCLKNLGYKVGLMDADLYGPSIPTMLGLKGERPKVQDVNGVPKIIPLQAYGMPVMSIGFIVEEQQAVVLRGPRLGAIIKQFISDCVWPDLDFLIIDLPPGTGDIQLTLVQTVPVTGAIMVTTPQDVAVSDAVKAMNMFLLPSVDVPILGVVENMSWFSPAELPENRYYLFGEGGGKKLAEMGETVVLSQIPIVQKVREGGDTGRPISLNEEAAVGDAFIKLARNVIKQLEIRLKESGPTVPVELKN